jgi:hypothetical protein
MGIVVLAALALVLDDDLTRINALKQTVSLSCNVAAAIVFIAVASIDWTLVGVMAVGSLAGGALGGKLATRVPAGVLRVVVVVVAVAVAVRYAAALIA